MVEKERKVRDGGEGECGGSGVEEVCSFFVTRKENIVVVVVFGEVVKGRETAMKCGRPPFFFP